MSEQVLWNPVRSADATLQASLKPCRMIFVSVTAGDGAAATIQLYDATSADATKLRFTFKAPAATTKEVGYIKGAVFSQLYLVLTGAGAEFSYGIV